MMIIGLKVEGYADDRQVLIDEMLKYAEEKLQSVPVPNSPDTGFDLYLWKKVSVESRAATSEEINIVKERFLTQLRNILDQRQEVLSRAEKDYKKIVLNGFKYDWRERSSKVGDTYLTFWYEEKELKELLDKINKEVDEDISKNSLSKTKEELIDELLNYAMSIFDGLEVPIKLDNKIVTKTQVESAKTKALKDIQECLQQYDSDVISRSISSVKQVIEFESNYQGSNEGKVEIALQQRIKSKIDKTKRIVDLEKYDKNWKAGMPKVWSKEKIEDAIKKGIVPTNIQNNYQNPISREEFAQLFITALLKNINNDFTVDYFLSKVSTTQIFTDTNSKYMRMANILGLMEPEEGNKFNPNGAITREAIATMLVNFFQRDLEGRGEDISDFVEDYDKISPCAKEDVERVYSYRLFGTAFNHGVERVDNTKEVFSPQKLITREEAIVMINEMENRLEYLPLRGYLFISFSDLMSGFDIDGNKIKMKKSGCDCKKKVKQRYNNYQYFNKTSLIIDYDTERLNAAFLFPRIDFGERVDNEYITRVVKGEYTCKEYDAFVVEHNKDGYLTIVTKKKDYGKFLGRNVIRNLKNNEIIPLKTVEKDEHPTLIKPALNEEERQTYLGYQNSSYPQQWTIEQPDGSVQYTDLKPIGTKIGYALETDVAVTLNGKNVKSYNIGGRIAIELDALKDFGYSYEFVDKSYDYNGKKIVRGQINLYMPEDKKLKQFNEKVKEKPSSVNGKVAYELIGDQYHIEIYDKKDKKTSKGIMRCFATNTGKRFILIDEIWNAQYFYIGKLGIPKSTCLLASLYKVEGSPYGCISLYQNNLAIVDKTNSKHFKVHMLSQEEYSKLNTYMLAKEYPQIIDQILKPEDLEAWHVAQKIVKKAVKPNMSDKEKSDALAKAIKTHGFYLDEYLVTNGLGYGNFDESYEALVQKYANASGWFEAFRMCYTIAGLDVRPKYRTAEWEKAFHYTNNSSLIAVKIDGKWEFVNFLPSPYYDKN